MKLYIGNKNYSSWSLRAWLVLKAFNIAFDEEVVPFQGSATHELFRRFSPSGKVPCLVDGDLVVWDSLAIAEYIAEQHDGVWPREALARSWARSAAAEMHAGFGLLRAQCGMSCGVRVKLNQFSTALMADWLRIDELWHDGLAKFGGPFLAGAAFTAVDAFYAPVAFRIQTYAPQLSPVALDYANLLLSLDSMRAWYDAALTETWRDQEHDAEISALGQVLEDLRTQP